MGLATTLRPLLTGFALLSTGAVVDSQFHGNANGGQSDLSAHVTDVTILPSNVLRLDVRIPLHNQGPFVPVVLFRKDGDSSHVVLSDNTLCSTLRFPTPYLSIPRPVNYSVALTDLQHGLCTGQGCTGSCGPDPDYPDQQACLPTKAMVDGRYPVPLKSGDSQALLVSMGVVSEVPAWQASLPVSQTTPQTYVLYSLRYNLTSLYSSCGLGGGPVHASLTTNGQTWQTVTYPFDVQVLVLRPAAAPIAGQPSGTFNIDTSLNQLQIARIPVKPTFYIGTEGGTIQAGIVNTQAFNNHATPSLVLVDVQSLSDTNGTGYIQIEARLTYSTLKRYYGVALTIGPNRQYTIDTAMIQEQFLPMSCCYRLQLVSATPVGNLSLLGHTGGYCADGQCDIDIVFRTESRELTDAGDAFLSCADVSLFDSAACSVDPSLRQPGYMGFRFDPSCLVSTTKGSLTPCASKQLIDANRADHFDVSVFQYVYSDKAAAVKYPALASIHTTDKYPASTARGVPVAITGASSTGGTMSLMEYTLRMDICTSRATDPTLQTLTGRNECGAYMVDQEADEAYQTANRINSQLEVYFVLQDTALWDSTDASMILRPDTLRVTLSLDNVANGTSTLGAPLPVLTYGGSSDIGVQAEFADFVNSTWSAAPNGWTGPASELANGTIPKLALKYPGVNGFAMSRSALVGYIRAAIGHGGFNRIAVTVSGQYTYGSTTGEVPSTPSHTGQSKVSKVLSQLSNTVASGEIGQAQRYIPETGIVVNPHDPFALSLGIKWSPFKHYQVTDTVTKANSGSIMYRPASQPKTAVAAASYDISVSYDDANAYIDCEGQTMTVPLARHLGTRSSDPLLLVSFILLITFSVIIVVSFVAVIASPKWLR
jgi:hypothetical protein